MHSKRTELRSEQLESLSKIKLNDLVRYIDDTITSAASVSQSTWNIRNDRVLCEIEPLDVFEYAFERLRSELVFRASDEGMKESSFDRVCRLCD